MSRSMWGFGLLALFAVGLRVVGGDQNQPASPAPAVNPTSTRAIVSPPEPSTVFAPAPRPTVAVPTSAIPPAVAEAVPPVGSTHVHSQAEIKYCLAEKVRIDTMDNIVDNRSSVQVTNFNSRVNDYNSRCGKFRYRQSDMDRARSAVEANRANLQAAGREIVRSWR